MKKPLFSPLKIGKLELNSRIVMAPLTRCRAVDQNVPNAIMADYYGQRAGAGLIIAEGTSPSPNGLGYRNIPGLFNEEMAEAWKKSTKAVHENGGKIFLQVMHTGRVGHTNNLPEGAELLAPSAIAQPGEISTYDLGKVSYPTPKEMTKNDIETAVQEFVKCAELSIEAGFDGIEIHCAHGYLPNQFINTASNQRTDNYGSTIENRCRFVLDVLSACSNAIGSDKVGIRISPFSYADTQEHDEFINEAYDYLVEQMNKMDLAYLHLSHMGDALPKKFELFKRIRANYNGVLIICGDYTKEKAEQALLNNDCDLVAFGRDYIANPDLVERFKNNWPLAERNNELWYGDGAEGYTDYPTYELSEPS